MAKQHQGDAKASRLAGLQARLGYCWTNADLLNEALTHSSAGKPDYQRLEFFGDRVLGLIIAELLLEVYPKAAEGELGRRHAALVREETLAVIARSWQLGDVISFGSGERLSGGAAKPAILADVVEALLGAMYMDGGLADARTLVRRDWHELVQVMEGRDAKTRLQEVLQSKRLALPQYVVLNQSGPDHDTYFRVRVSCGLGSADGEGRNKRAAEMVAAGLLLESFGLPDEGG